MLVARRAVLGHAHHAEPKVRIWEVLGHFELMHGRFWHGRIVQIFGGSFKDTDMRLPVELRPIMALKVGVVGMRGIGETHAKAHSKDPLANLAAVCDVVKERADKAAQQFGVKAYYSLAAMMRNEELDIVDVTTGGPENGGWHFEPTMEALAADLQRHR